MPEDISFDEDQKSGTIRQRNHMKVLLISQEKEDYNIITRMMKNLYKNVDVVCAVNQEEAINYTSIDGPFAYFIVDCEIKNIEPDALCRELIDFTGDRPIIFLGHEAIIDSRISDELFESNPNNEKLLKPVYRDDFQEDFTKTTAHAMEYAQKEEFESSIEDINPDDFIPMKLKGFFLYKSFPYDLYVEITPTRYLKAIEKNRPYTISQLSQYAKKSIRYLYIKKDEQLKYLEDEAKKCLKAFAAPSKASGENILVTLRAFTLIHQSLITIGITPMVTELSEKSIDMIIYIFDNERNISKLLDDFPQVYSGIASKSVLTAIFSLLLCRLMKWDSDLTRRKLVFAALLHDYSLPDEDMTHINTANDSRLIQSYDEAQIEEFIGHPIKSSEIAKQFSGYSDIDFIIENHHETPNRKGFPNKPSHTKLTPLCSVFNISQFLAGELDGMHVNKRNLTSSVRLMNRDYNSGNFKEPLKLILDFIKKKF